MADMRRPLIIIAFYLMISVAAPVIAGGPVVIMKRKYFTLPPSTPCISGLIARAISRFQPDYNPDLYGKTYEDTTVWTAEDGAEIMSIERTRSTGFSEITFQGYRGVWRSSTHSSTWSSARGLHTKTDDMNYEEIWRFEVFGRPYAWADGKWIPATRGYDVPPAKDGLRFKSDDGTIEGSWTYVGDFSVPGGNRYTETYKLEMRHPNWPSHLESYEICAPNIGMVFRKHGNKTTTRRFINDPNE